MERAEGQSGPMQKWRPTSVKFAALLQGFFVASRLFEFTRHLRSPCQGDCRCGSDVPLSQLALHMLIGNPLDMASRSRFFPGREAASSALKMKRGNLLEPSKPLCCIKGDAKPAANRRPDVL